MLDFNVLNIITWLLFMNNLGVVQILRNKFPEIIDGILRPEAGIVGCGRRPQHH